jgi:hypothetical protein
VGGGGGYGVGDLRAEVRSQRSGSRGWTLADDGGVGHVAAFWAAIGCGAEVVAAAWADAEAIEAARAEDGEEAECGEDGEEESEEPVGEEDDAISKHCAPNVPTADEGDQPWIVAEVERRRGRIGEVLPNPSLGVAGDGTLEKNQFTGVAPYRDGLEPRMRVAAREFFKM